MAAGAAMPAPETLEIDLVADLEAATDAPGDSTSWLRLDFPFPGPLTFAAGAPIVLQKAGQLAALHDRAWFEKIHVRPRLSELGAVLSDQTIDVEVWNAYRARARNLEEIQVLGPDGVSVADPWGTPTHYEATRSRIYTVTVSAEGDPRVDNAVVWVFTGEDEEGTDHQLLGFRALPWAFEPNMEAGIGERYGYLTDLQRARDGSEQRIQLRAVAIGAITLAHLFTEARDAQFANSLLYGNQARPFGVPLWQFRNRLTTDAAAASSVLVVDTSDIPWHPQDLVLVYRSPYSWEVQRVETIEADRLNLTLPLNETWTAGAWVMPLVIGRLSQAERFNWEALKIGSASLTFDVDGFFV